MDFIATQPDANNRFTRSQSSPPLFDLATTQINNPSTTVSKKRFAFNNTEIAKTVAIGLDFPSESAYLNQYIRASTQRGSAATGNYFSIGELFGSAAIDDTVITVDFQPGDGALVTIATGTKAIIQSPVVSDAHTDNAIEIVEVDSVVWTGDQCEITLVAGLTLDWADNSTVSLAILATSVAATLDNVVKTGLTMDHLQIALTNAATIEQTWTITFTSASAFTCSGDTVGALATGNTSGTYAPLNPVTNTAYFSIPAAAWTSTNAGNTLVFQTHPAAVPVMTECIVFTGETAGKKDNIGALVIAAA